LSSRPWQVAGLRGHPVPLRERSHPRDRHCAVDADASWDP
jgi:hypothetical protein